MQRHIRKVYALFHWAAECNVVSGKGGGLHTCCSQGKRALLQSSELSLCLHALGSSPNLLRESYLF